MASQVFLDPVAFNQRVAAIGFFPARAEFFNQGVKQQMKAKQQVLLTLVQAQTIMVRLAKVGLIGTLYARNPVGTGGNNIGADYMSESQIVEEGLQKKKLEYQIKTPAGLAPEFSAGEQAAKLAKGLEGYAGLWAEYHPGSSRGDGLAQLFNLPAVKKAAEAALKAL